MSRFTLDVDYLGGIPFVLPRWPVPPGVRAALTTRRGGVSRGPYRSLNLGERCGDEPAAVAENRQRVAKALGLPTPPAWLHQVHGRRVVAASAPAHPPVEADGSVAFGPGAVCAVLAADCLPVLLCERRAQGVAALHAGWRGLAAGVLEAGVKAMGQSPADLMAWLGPAISCAAFEVGDEVREAFVLHDAGAAACFRPARPGHWYADLYALARRRLKAAGVGEIHGGDLCTYRIPDWFFSYRREGRCGRMAALIWLQ